MTGHVYSRGFVYFEGEWPREEQCEWCFTEQFKNKSQLRVQVSSNKHGKTHVNLCLSCWFKLAFMR